MNRVSHYFFIIFFKLFCHWRPSKKSIGTHFTQFDAVSRVQELEGLLEVKELLPTAEAKAEAGKLAALKVGINDASATATANWKFLLWFSV